MVNDFVFWLNRAGNIGQTIWLLGNALLIPLQICVLLLYQAEFEGILFMYQFLGVNYRSPNLLK